MDTGARIPPILPRSAAVSAAALPPGRAPRELSSNTPSLLLRLRQPRSVPGATLRCRRDTQDTSAVRIYEAFTLIEIMVVVALMMVTMTIGVPIVYNSWHKQPLTTAINDVLDICSAARARAIMGQKTTEMIIHPQSGQISVAGGGGGGGSEPSGEAGRINVRGAIPTASGISSATFSDRVSIDMLDINLMEYKETQEARVRFYPDGRCDELLLILRSVEGEQRGVTLEITTGLPTVLNEEDLRNLMSR
jgi:Tfp pilus assembly protein FimT